MDHQHIPQHCTGRYQDTREDQVDQEQTGGVQSTKTYKRWGSPGRKQRWQLLTDTDGVGVWPNVSSWIRAESINQITDVHVVSMTSILGSAWHHMANVITGAELSSMHWAHSLHYRL